MVTTGPLGMLGVRQSTGPKAGSEIDATGVAAAGGRPTEHRRASFLCPPSDSLQSDGPAAGNARLAPVPRAIMVCAPCDPPAGDRRRPRARFDETLAKKLLQGVRREA